MEYIFLCRTISDNLSTENFKSMTIWTLNICSLSSSIILEFLEEIILCNNRHRNATRGIWNMMHSNGAIEVHKDSVQVSTANAVFNRIMCTQYKVIEKLWQM